jgi:hypothetical protein
MTAAAIAGKMRHRLPPASYMIPDDFSTAMCGVA